MVLEPSNLEVPFGFKAILYIIKNLIHGDFKPIIMKAVNKVSLFLFLLLFFLEWGEGG